MRLILTSAIPLIPFASLLAFKSLLLAQISLEILREPRVASLRAPDDHVLAVHVHVALETILACFQLFAQE